MPFTPRVHPRFRRHAAVLLPCPPAGGPAGSPRHLTNEPPNPVSTHTEGVRAYFPLNPGRLTTCQRHASRKQDPCLLALLTSLLYSTRGVELARWGSTGGVLFAPEAEQLQLLEPQVGNHLKRNSTLDSSLPDNPILFGVCVTRAILHFSITSLIKSHPTPPPDTYTHTHTCKAGPPG